jgi:hypothetical protein
MKKTLERQSRLVMAHPRVRALDENAAEKDTEKGVALLERVVPGKQKKPSRTRTTSWTGAMTAAAPRRCSCPTTTVTTTTRLAQRHANEHVKKKRNLGRHAVVGHNVGMRALLQHVNLLLHLRLVLLAVIRQLLDGQTRLARHVSPHVHGAKRARSQLLLNRKQILARPVHLLVDVRRVHHVKGQRDGASALPLGRRKLLGLLVALVDAGEQALLLLVLGLAPFDVLHLVRGDIGAEETS